jgi:hypothetical protein
MSSPFDSGHILGKYSAVRDNWYRTVGFSWSILNKGAWTICACLTLFHAALGLLAQAHCDLTLHKES